MLEIAVNGADLDWEPATGYPDGTLWKVLRRDDGDNPLTVLLKLPPGFAMEGHAHVAVEHHYVLEGAYEAAGRHHGPGTYRMIPEHAEHGPFRSADGAVVLVVWQPCR